MSEEVLKKIDDLIGEGVVEEAVKYPSQQEAEWFLEFAEAINKASWGIPSPELKKFYEKVDAQKMKLWPKYFGDKSPWIVERKRNKPSVEWDKFKADQLGL